MYQVSVMAIVARMVRTMNRVIAFLSAVGE
jgi:hypothetical protein